MQKYSAAFLSAVLLVLSFGASNTMAASSRHAVLIYDATNKRVVQQENGYAQRYPASLTKMMTLYMLFDALRTGKVTMHTRMKASQFAASQPQTNVGIRGGETITVAQAINALVIRSANDIAVVVAEHLGKSQANFAFMMNRKARELGMRNTVFKNPHGLPDARQHTTAMDMALLGAALRRHFPQYYHAFKASSFTFKGVRYTTHNRVLNKLGGVDGIKTGYINASGFNLVSSLKRDGFNLVAVVMGGTTAAERDARMVKLLGAAYTRLAAERQKNGAVQVAERSADSPARPAPSVQPERIVPVVQTARPVDAGATGQTLNYQLASFGETYPVPTLRAEYAGLPREWAVQIGVFGDAQSARRALAAVASKITGDVANAQHNVEYATQGNRGFHRARFTNLVREDANAVCRKLQRLHQDCFVTRVN